MDEAGRVERRLNELAARLDSQLRQLQRTAEAAETNTLGVETLERRLWRTLALLVLILILTAAGLALEIWARWL